MECMKRTNDLHTTQQCLMLLSKGAQLFPVNFILTKQKYFILCLGKVN
jgi:hypothetical protein